MDVTCENQGDRQRLCSWFASWNMATSTADEERDMTAAEFKTFRDVLGRSQRQLAHLLGVSARAIQSFEQGWRNVPHYVERQFLFLVTLSMRGRRGRTPCWEVRGCPTGQRNQCPAWEFNAGDLCWFINGTICRSKPEPSWNKKMETCRRCEVFVAAFSLPASKPARRRRE